MQLNYVQFSLAIPASEYLTLYNGWARQILVRSHSGLRVQLPSAIFQPFVEHRGVYGEFEVAFTAEGKFHSIRRLNQNTE
ncbi:MAG TPA: DUF2835 family protein [Cellvibrionaceae bacterium]|jgi:hypothetical protein